MDRCSIKEFKNGNNFWLHKETKWEDEESTKYSNDKNFARGFMTGLKNSPLLYTETKW